MDADAISASGTNHKNMSRTYDETRWGDQRKMRAKAKVNIRRRDRKRLGKPNEDSLVIEPIFKRTKFTSIK